jgi:hypothetical protein
MKLAVCYSCLQHWLSAVCDIKKQKDELQLFVAASEIVKALFKGQTLK